MRKKKIVIDMPKAFIEWSLVIWWEEKGCEDFLQWASKKGIAYVDEEISADKTNRLGR